MSAYIMYATRRYLSTSIARSSKSYQHVAASAITGSHGEGSRIWRNLSLFVAMPAVILATIHCVIAHKKHEEHFVRPPFVKYEFMYTRTKRFPWGDGNHTLLHNPRKNALPEGYEDEL